LEIIQKYRDNLENKIKELKGNISFKIENIKELDLLN
jgi:hypothetical protein